MTYRKFYWENLNNKQVLNFHNVFGVFGGIVEKVIDPFRPTVIAWKGSVFDASGVTNTYNGPALDEKSLMKWVENMIIGKCKEIQKAIAA